MDKTKIIEAAAKLVAKGAYDKAIKEYQKILNADPKDVRVLQKLGELYQKKNDNAQAAQFFIKVAEGYSTEGFFLKAVALYKQVLKLSPSMVEVNLRLAELHEQLQLMSEAAAYYQLVANHYEQSGNIRASLDMLKKLVDVSPENVTSRVKLAELYGRERMVGEALEEFKRAAEYLKRYNRTEDHVRVLERAYALDEKSTQLARELAEAYLASSDYKKAIARLQICFKANPKDMEMLQMLARAFEGDGQTKKAVSVYKELAKIYADQKRTHDAEELWSKIEQLDPHDSELINHQRSADPFGLSPGALEPVQVPQPSPVAPPAPPQAQRAQDPVARVLTETDVYLKYGLHDRALEHLGKIFAQDPENLEAHEKAYQIYVAANNRGQALDQLVNVLRLCTRSGNVSRGQQYLQILQEQAPQHPELPVFSSVLGESVSATAEPVEDLSDADLLIEPETETVAVQSESSVEVEQDLGLESVGAFESEEVIGEEDGTTSQVEEASDESAHLLDDEPLLEPSEPEGEPLEEDSFGVEVSESFDLEEPAAVEAEPPVAEAVVEVPPEEDPAADEVAEASFFVDQGLYDDARETLETVLIAYPEHAEAQALMSRLEQLEEEKQKAKAKVRPPAQSAPAKSPASVRAPPGAAKAPSRSLSPSPKGPEPAAYPAAPTEARIVDAGDFQYPVEEVLAEFRRGVQKVVQPSDVDTHYDLGIAYKEMGLIDDALAEFTVARQGCLRQRKEIDCLTMISMLRQMKGDLSGAIESLKQALINEHATPDRKKALQYDLATAWEMAGNLGKALYHYQRVLKVDPGYRDVAKIVPRLSATTKPEDDPLPGKQPGAVSARP